MLRFAVGARVQAALVILLFLASLAVLFFNSVTAFLLPGEEPRAREDAAAAAADLATAEGPVVDETLPLQGEVVPPRTERRLADAADRVLAGRPGVEGGVYLGGRLDQFSGGAFPTGHGRPPHPGPPPGPPPGPARPPGPPPRRDPPPLEAPYIRQQVRDCLTNEPGAPPLVQALDVGPSRVVVATAPIGPDRPAAAAVWVMIRLTGPEQMQAQNVRYQVSTGLALAGVLLALLLTATLARSVRQERRRREGLADELRRAEHLASLGRLLAGVAHEVRNPLAGIRSTVQLWHRLPDQARPPASLEAVLQAVDRLNGLVGRLLYFARTGWDERRPVDLNAVARETVELLRAQAEAQGVRIDADLAADLPPVAGSAAALQQVSLNLATNALQAMPKGGVLRLETRAPAGPRRVELLVADTGPGVSPEARARLFEPFYTTRPDGTGLGLALCREIVRQHGGDLVLGNGDAPGAAFRVTLPAAEESWGIVMSRVPHRATVLVADDDDVIRSNLALLLRSEGYDVREAADGGAAAKALEDPAIALALLDLKMPVRDGMDVLRGHADRLDETPVIVVKAYGGGAAAIEAMKLGAYDYITKPFDLDDVLFAVRRALTQRTLAAQVEALSGERFGDADDEELAGAARP